MITDPRFFGQAAQVFAAGSDYPSLPAFLGQEEEVAASLPAPEPEPGDRTVVATGTPAVLPAAKARPLAPWRIAAILAGVTIIAIQLGPSAAGLVGALFHRNPPAGPTPEPAPVPAAPPAGPEVAADILTGSGTAPDPATIKVAGETIRLAGITPVDHPGARRGFDAFVRAAGLLRCETALGKGRCLTAKGVDLAEAAVLSGMAQVAADGSPSLRADEAEARKNRRGVWGLGD